MYLNKLEIFGFKSFAQKTMFKFDDGLTAIIGPNGCGKSNIVDAIRWVLGEQRPTILRCDRMENVIFNGTASRKPLSISEVSMFIENTKQILPSEYTEIKITRRLYRSGESEYMLNNQPVRLMDIINLFADTGMGADAYSVIELKMVEQILSENAEERRRLFEEAAGIKKYKTRRKSALRKLDTTHQELTRLDDIISEVQKNVNSLSRQVGKARRYHEFNDELKKKDYIVSQLKIRSYESDLRPLEMEYGQIKRSKETLTAEIQTEEAQIERLQAQVVEMEHSYRGIAGRLQKADESIHEFQRDRQLRLQKIESLQERISSDEDEIKIQEQRIKDLDKKKKQFLAEVEKTRKEMNKIHADYQKSLEKQQKTDGEYRLVREEYQSFVRDNLQKFQESDKDKEAFQKIKVEKESLGEQLAKMETNLKGLRSSLQNADNVFKIQQKKIEESKKNYNGEQEKLDRLQKQIQGFEQQQAQLRSEINKMEGQHEKIRNRRDFLENLIENYEGFSESVQYIMLRRLEFGGLKDTLINLVSSPEQYRSAVENYLADISNYLVVEDVDTARQILMQVREREKGRLTLISLDMLNHARPVSPNNLPDGAESRRMKDVIDFDEKYEKLFKLLFDHVYLVHDLDTAVKMHQKHPHFTFVTNDGEVLQDWGNITGGMANDDHSLMGRSQQFEKVKAELELISQELEKKKTGLGESIAESQKQQGKFSEASELHKTAEKQISMMEKEADQVGYEVSRLKESVSETEREMESIQQLRKKLTDDEKGLLPKIQELDENIHNYQLKEKEIQQDQDIHEEKLRQMAEVSQKLQIEFLNLTSREKELNQKLEFLEQNRKDAGKFIEQRKQQIHKGTEEIEGLQNQGEGENEHLTSAYEKRDLIDTQRNELEKRLNNLKSTIQSQDVELKKRQRLLNEARDRLQKLELQIQELQVKKSGLKEQLEEKYGKEATRAEGEKLDPALTVHQVQAEIEDLREKLDRLGDVNPLAVKEHEKEKERLDFLRSQKDDLVSAEDQLMETIHKLNTTARKEFMTAFSKIRENFRKVFGEFFENGEGDLLLVESRDPLEANIDFTVNHKGRQLNTLTLLSAGEKTLTAISLLFAIYLVKPSPFCILDEVDAPLDDVNITNYTQAIKRFSKDTQFILVTHNKRTIEATQSLYGITMEEPGVSKVVSVRLD
jgi:chromosome segregation protein